MAVLDNFWPDFGNEDLFVEVSQTGPTGSLAVDVLNRFGIPCSDSDGGNLTNLDIKKMDAFTVLRLSLLEASAGTGSLLEPIVSPDGEVEFKEIGNYSGNVSDVYYSMQTGSWQEPCEGVMITGGRPLPRRKPLDWKPIWGDEAQIYSYQDMLNNCNLPGFKKYASIVFNDPNLQSGYEDGIENLYELNRSNPWDKIIGYATYRNPPPDLMNEGVTIDYVNTATIPIEIGNSLGTLKKLPQISDWEVDCWSGDGEVVEPDGGVIVPIPSHFRYETVREIIEDKLIKVSGVYIIGRDIDFLKAAPVDDFAASSTPSDTNSKIWLSMQDLSVKATKLKEGINYAVAYEDVGDGKQPYIVFARDVRVNDPAEYGDGCQYYIDPFCAAAEQGIDSGEGNILPISQTRGLLVDQIWVTVDLTTPAVVITDPKGNALEIAQNLEYYLAAMVVEEQPTPIGFSNGSSRLIDQSQDLRDHDPTTTQSFEDTDLEQAMDEMQGGGFSITLSFLDEDQVVEMADTLYDYMNTQAGVEVVYTCGPDCEPKLGGYGNAGGIINSIQYSYTDSGAYTISVHEGSYLVGNLAQVDGGPTQKMAEDFGASGTIIEDLGNGIHYKIRLDGYGYRWGINMCHNIIRVGDKVSCTVHNNPIES